MWSRTKTATAMAFRDQRRRPLVLILLVLLPAYVITKSIAQTEATPRRIELPGDVWITTTMKNLHGPEMGKLSVAFAAALVGVFVMQSALQGDRRLVAAGYHAGEAVLARLSVLLAATLLVVSVAVLVTAIFVTPASWPPLVAALILVGLIYGAFGALAGALLDKLAATYLILFLVMTDLGVVQSAMFHAARFASPGCCPDTRRLASCSTAALPTHSTLASTSRSRSAGWPSCRQPSISCCDARSEYALDTRWGYARVRVVRIVESA